MQSAPRPLTPVADLPGAKPNTKQTWRRRLLIGAAVAILAAGAIYGAHWFLVGRFLQTTDNAYFQADNAVVAPKVSGYVSAVDIADNQLVAAGQVLARIDDRDYRIELAQAEADVAQAKAELGNIAAQIEQQKARLAQANAGLASSGASAEFAAQEAGRFNTLVGSGAVSLKQAQQALSERKRANAAVAESQAAVEETQKQVGVLESARMKADAALQRAQAGLDQAKLRLSYTQLTAPIAGVVGDRSVRVGQYVQPGSRLLTIVPVQDVYLVANFKETQLRAICRGERVAVSVDTYPGLDVTGTVDSVAPGTGAQFALLPAENATGNFTKIVQRVPVKILVDRDSLQGVELRPGLSATATVDTRNAAPEACTTLVVPAQPRR
ncbi:MAG TPA: HlyD family secretion protein [Alphaproteobacteria bacterium]|jgi:membrane fusion protein (multidrug efflux system)|nr:HlyD family secretion protein [Alphaproteobacteria bacterium]